MRVLCSAGKPLKNAQVSGFPRALIFLAVMRIRALESRLKGKQECYRSKREQLNLSGSFVRNDDGNRDDNVINQRFDWLNEEIESC